MDIFINTLVLSTSYKITTTICWIKLFVFFKQKKCIIYIRAFKLFLSRTYVNILFNKFQTSPVESFWNIMAKIWDNIEKDQNYITKQTRPLWLEMCIQNRWRTDVDIQIEILQFVLNPLWLICTKNYQNQFSTVFFWNPDSWNFG